MWFALVWGPRLDLEVLLAYSWLSRSSGFGPAGAWRTLGGDIQIDPELVQWKTKAFYLVLREVALLFFLISSTLAWIHTAHIVSLHLYAIMAKCPSAVMALELYYWWT